MVKLAAHHRRTAGEGYPGADGAWGGSPGEPQRHDRAPAVAHDRTPFKLIQIQTRDRRILGTAATQGRRAPLHRRGKLATGARRVRRAGAPLVLGAGLTPHLSQGIVLAALRTVAGS